MIHNYYSLLEPTLTFLDKGTFIHYKKVGTRFLGELSSFCNQTDNVSQIDLRITSRNLGTSDDNFFQYFGYELNTIPKHLDDLNYYLGIDGYTNIYDYLLNNNKRDIVYIIRNPMKRYISGLVEAIYAYFADDLSELEVDKLKLNCKLNNDDIDTLKKYFDRYHSTSFERKIDDDILYNFYQYFVTHKFYYSLDDVHTQNYLLFYDFIINNSKTDTIKIVDIDKCNTPRALQFFQKLSNSDIKEFWAEKILFKQSNNVFYEKLSNVLNNRNFSNHIYSYLKYEFLAYDRLLKSKYYVDL